ncbi:MAG: type I DNA topoisomerase [Bacteroidales bacterium]
MAKSLVIVESPAKAKTLSRFLGRDYRVEASFGHIRDLPQNASEVPQEIRSEPWGTLAVDVDSDFKPYWVIPASKRRQVTALRSAMKEAEEVLLATDPDREGESISWHLKEVLKLKNARRVTFHEITREAVRDAIEHAHTLDENLVNAQESRRILDRLYGYTLSPLLWKFIRTGLSAGRVQSIAVRLIVEREEARRAFRSSVYWDIEARLSADGREFPATLVRVGDARLASGRDFDQLTGDLTGRNVYHVDEQAAARLASALRQHLPWRVTAVDVKPGIERPAPPFTTSTLTQEASRKLGFSTGRTMRIAQRLKDGVDLADGSIEGIITYHRTDSTTLSERALNESARAIREMFGDEYYSGPRRYQTQVRNAQEAHEAIRPTDFNLTPANLVGVLDSDELRLYELIWKRTMASQMPDARVLKTTVEFTAEGPGGEPCVLTASGKAIEFAGYRRAYVEVSDDPDSELEAQETILPAFREGDLVGREGTAGVRAMLANLEPKRHETVPPARFTEASLIKKLEEEGIGRPSTYEPTIETILSRGYVFRQGKALVPSFTAFAVTKFLRDYFGDYVEVGFTSEMEKDLDEISNGERARLDFLRSFFRGDGKRKGLEQIIKDAEKRADYPVLDVGADPDSGETVRVRIGRFGPFVQVGEGGPGKTASLPDDIPPADLTVEKAIALVQAKASGPRDLGVDPKSGQHVYVSTGRFGPYVQLGETPDTPKKGAKVPKPKRASLPKDVTEATVGLPLALKLLSLPRELGNDPATGEQISAAVGRFGPYVKRGDEYRSVDASDDVYTITRERALELLAMPKQPRRRQAAAKTVLRELGTRTDSGAAVKLYEGRYGPYVSDGKTNASIPKGSDPASIGLREATELLDARAAAGPRKKPGARAKRTGGGRGRKRSEPVEVS